MMSGKNNTAVAIADVEDADLPRWNAFLAAVAGGAAIPDAMLSAKVTRTELERMTLVPQEAQRFLEACAANKRRDFSTLDFMEVCARIATGLTATDAVLAVRGADETPAFFQLTAMPGLKQHYESAKRASVNLQFEKILDIVDDTSRDVLEQAKGPAGNMAAVSRDRLRFDARVRLASAYDENWSERKAPT